MELIISSDQGNQRLKLLLNTHFASHDFRSLCCFGQAGAEVSLGLFNSLCILPLTDWVLHLDHSSSIISPSLSASPFSDAQKTEYVSENITILFTNILRNHAKSDFILELITLALLGPLPYLVLRRTLAVVTSLCHHFLNCDGASPCPSTVLF